VSDLNNGFGCYKANFSLPSPLMAMRPSIVVRDGGTVIPLHLKSLRKIWQMLVKIEHKF